MRGFGRFCRVLVVFVLAGSATGCGSASRQVPEEAAESQMLVNLAENYRMYSIAKKQPPRGLADLNAMQAMVGSEIEEVRRGNIIVQWGAKLPDISEEPGLVASPEVLAYWKDVPEKGGYVLMLDRTVKKMTPEEFRAAPKSGKEPAPAKAKR